MRKLRFIALLLVMPLMLWAGEYQVGRQYPLIDLLVTDFLEQSKLPGVAITISRDGEIVYSKGHGYADVEQKISMKPETQIRAASVSKVITATGLARLLTEGKLDLDIPIGQYIPELSEPFASLTCRQLAGHTSGIQHRPPRKNHKKRHYETIEETLALFKNTSLMFEPDTKYEYSSNAYNLLAAVIERVSGKSYLDYMQEDIFEPLGMVHTTRDLKTELTENDAKMYYFKKGKLTLDRTFSDGTHKLAGAGFKTTSVDLVRMMKAYNNGFISGRVVKSMFASHTLNNGEKTNVGVGWRINRDMAGRATIEHAGSRQGARTVIVYYPEENLSISLMINAKCTVFIEETAHIIAEVVLENTLERPKVEEVVTDVKVLSYDEDGQEKENNGNLIEQEGFTGKFIMDTKSLWIQESHIIALDAKNYALSTDFGLLYLKVDTKLNWKGEVFLYQLMSDKYHPMNTPFLRIVQEE